MKRVISICLALWLSVFCCYALETHSKLAELPESVEPKLVEPEEPIPEDNPLEEQPPNAVEELPTINKSEVEYRTVDNTVLLESIENKLDDLVLLGNLFCFAIIPFILCCVLVFKLAEWFENTFVEPFV